MGRISRRNFINGTLVAAGASMLPLGSTRQSAMAAIDPSYYPPALTGLRGSHPGSYDHAHSRAWTKRSNWGPTTELNEVYDLVVVGGGISGLAAALFYQQVHGQDKKVLILDNHDDFGGHATRNEHTIGDNTRLGYGGSQTIVSPHAQSKVARKLLEDIGIDIDRFKTAFDVDFFKRHNLGPATYFNKKKFGVDKVVKHPFSNYHRFMEGLQDATLSDEEAAAQAPLSEKGKKQLLTVLKSDLRVLNLPQEALEEYIWETSYFDYLKNTLGVDDPGVLEIARNSCVDNAGPGTDTMTIGGVLDSGGLGLKPESIKYVMGEEAYQAYIKESGNLMAEEDPYIHHFPDGNASIARGLVKKMIPAVGEGNNAEALVLSKFDYSELDKSTNIVRIRLNSTVVKVRHSGDPTTSSEVSVKYINDHNAYQVTGKGVVMACYNMMIPHIVDDLPKTQEAALRRHTKMPIQYTTVGLKNWRPWKEMKIGLAMSPGNIHQVSFIDFPVNIGGYEAPKTPDDPCILNMVSCPFGQTVGAPPREQYKEARYKMLGMQFEDYETEMRDHLTHMLSAGSFDFERDVESITLNRWSHGYAWWGNALFDPDMWNMAIIGRQPFGRITIANCDASVDAYAHVAIDEAWRAVKELG